MKQLGWELVDEVKMEVSEKMHANYPAFLEYPGAGLGPGQNENAQAGLYGHF